jgi:hypothetical protein
MQRLLAPRGEVLLWTVVFVDGVADGQTQKSDRKRRDSEGQQQRRCCRAATLAT